MTSRNEYMRVYMLKRYRQRINAAIGFLGGHCAKCFDTLGLELDHIDPKTKSFTIGQMWSVSENRFWNEVKKCQLLCPKHHQEKSMSERGHRPAKGTHGTLSSYRYCKCILCREVMNKYNREWKKKKRLHNSMGRGAPFKRCGGGSNPSGVTGI